MSKNKYMLMVAAVAILLIPAIAGSSNGDNKKNIVLTKDNTLTLNSEVSDSSVGELIEKAKKLDSKSFYYTKKPLYLFLNTPGGSIQAGLELIDTLNGLNRRVDTITLFAASMGFQIVQNMGNRYILKNGVLMSHHAYGGGEGEMGGEEPSQLRNRLALWEQRILELDEQTVKRTNGKQTLASYQKAYNKELWMTGSQSIEGGYADNIMSVSCDSSLDGTTSHDINFMGLAIHFELSNCPLLTSPLNVTIGLATTNGFMEYKTFLKNQGGFGEACLLRPQTLMKTVCALDTTLSPAKIDQVKQLFLETYQGKHTQVVDKY